MCQRKVCIVTGASSGLGLLTAKKLIEKDYYVILACRDETKTATVIDRLRKETGRNHFVSITLDLGSFQSIRNFVDEFHRRNLSLDVLINNAGVFMRHFHKSSDGIEYTFAVNNLGHFLLTNLLLNDLKKCPLSRIVIVSSKLHDSSVQRGKPLNFKWNLDQINESADFDGMVAYKNSKLANVWFGYELSRRLKQTNVSVHIICPGFVPTTGLSRESNFFQRFLMYYLMPLFPFARSEEFGSDCELFAATSETLNGQTGTFMSDMKQIESSSESCDPEKAKELWILSERLIK